MSTNNSVGSIRDELLDLAGTLADTQTRLDQLVERLDESEEISTVWQTRCEELERSLQETVNSAKWLRAQNEDLERRLNSHQPEIRGALDARQAAFRRLKHARRVIRDLLEERQDMSSPRAGTLTQEDIEEALYGGEVFHPDDNSSSSSDTNRTVRVGRSPVLDTLSASSTLKSAPGPSFSPILQGRIARLSPGYVKSPVLKNTPSSAESSNLIRLSPASKNSPETVSIHFKKPPGSATVRKGPFTIEKLQSYLGLADDAMDSLRSLRSSSEMKMRMHIMQLADTEQNVAFLYDPIFVESGEKSYAINWSRPDTNKTLQQEILRQKQRNSVFHTFTYPLKEQKAWFYIGAHQWSVVDSLGDLWPLEGKYRTTMIKKLCERTRGEVNEEEMGRMLDDGELQQVSIELVGVLDTKISIDFAQNNLGRSPTHQLERRNAGSVQSE